MTSRTDAFLTNTRQFHYGRTGSGSLTGAVDEGPLVALVFWAHAWLQAHVLGLALLALLRRPLHGPPVGALNAQTLSRAAGIPAPAALRLLQALRTRPQARTVLG